MAKAIHRIKYKAPKKKQRVTLENTFFKQMNNSLFSKTLENEGKHRNIKLVANDKRTNDLVSELHYHSANWFTDKLLALEMGKAILQLLNLYDLL